MGQRCFPPFPHYSQATSMTNKVQNCEILPSENSHIFEKIFLTPPQKKPNNAIAVLVIFPLTLTNPKLAYVCHFMFMVDHTKHEHGVRLFCQLSQSCIIPLITSTLICNQIQSHKFKKVISSNASLKKGVPISYRV